MWWACGCGRGGALLVYWGALAGPLPAAHFWEGGSEGLPGCRDQIAVAGAWNTRCALVYLLHSCSVTWPGACAVYWWRVPPALPMQGREASAGAARQQCAGGGLWARRGAQVRTKQTAAGAQPCQRAAHCVSWMGACPGWWAPSHPGGACAAAYTAGRSAASWQRFTGGNALVGQRLLPFGGGWASACCLLCGGAGQSQRQGRYTCCPPAAPAPSHRAGGVACTIQQQHTAKSPPAPPPIHRPTPAPQDLLPVQPPRGGLWAPGVWRAQHQRAVWHQRHLELGHVAHRAAGATRCVEWKVVLVVVVVVVGGWLGAWLTARLAPQGVWFVLVCACFFWRGGGEGGNSTSCSALAAKCMVLQGLSPAPPNPLPACAKRQKTKPDPAAWPLGPFAWRRLAAGPPPPPPHPPHTHFVQAQLGNFFL